MDGVSSAENCGHVFQNPNREASAHYGIGKNGEISQYVDEKILLGQTETGIAISILSRLKIQMEVIQQDIA